MPDTQTQGGVSAPSIVTAELDDMEVQILWSWHDARAEFFADRDDECEWSLHAARRDELAALRRIDPRTPPWKRWCSLGGLFGWMRQVGGLR